MDTYYPKTRRITASAPLKRPAQSVTPPKPAKLLATPTTPKDQRIARPKDPPPLVKPPKPTDIDRSNEIRNTTVRKLFKNVHPLKKDILDVQPLETKATTRKSQLALFKTPTSTSNSSTPPISPSKITAGPLKGVSTSLLDLIRAKEAASKLVNPEDEKRKVLLGLASSVSRIVTTIFTVNNKDIMPYDTVVDKCHKALKSNYETTTIDDCLKLMDEVVPEWITTVTISRGRFMRINKDKYSIPQLLEAIKKYKSSKTKK